MIVKLTDYEYTLCVLFSEQSARSQKQIEFGNKETAKRSIFEIKEDTLCGKMGEVAVVKLLHERYGLHIPVNYEVYPIEEGDDEDITLNGVTIDVKTSKYGKYLLLEQNKVDLRMRQGLLPDMLIMCKADIADRAVDIVGCISTRRLVDPENAKVKRLEAGRYIPETRVPLQADNYCVAFSDLYEVTKAFDHIVKGA